VIIATAGDLALSSQQPTATISTKWFIEPLSGAMFYFDEMLKLSARIEEIALKKLVDNEELQGLVLNPLIPPVIRPARALDECCTRYKSNDMVLYPTLLDGATVLRRATPAKQNDGRNWLILDPTPTQVGLPLPRGPPEPTCRCAFVLQLLSSRPARANVRQAAHAELWKLAFDLAVSDLAELGVPGGLAYDISFNKFGLRLAFVGISQTLPSYTRRLCRRLIEHNFRLLTGPQMLPSTLTASAVALASRTPGITQKRRRPIVSNLRAATAYDAASEGVAFFRSCNGAVCFAQGDLLQIEVDVLLENLRNMFETAMGPSDRAAVAMPTIDDLSYKPIWKPRAASPCAVAGGILISDACGRVPR